MSNINTYIKYIVTYKKVLKAYINVGLRYSLKG